jgi:hypothetical protein
MAFPTGGGERADWNSCLNGWLMHFSLMHFLLDAFFT